jgi:transcriptional regulator with XRE-family HTH domain
MKAKHSDQRALDNRKANDIDSHVGKRLRQRRIIRGLSQKELAAMLGISAQQLHKYEIGQNRITAARLYSCADVLDVPVWSFYLGLPVPGSHGELDGGSNGPNAPSDQLPNLLSMIDDIQLREKIVALVEAFSARLRKS